MVCAEIMGLSENPPFKRGKEGEATMVAQPSGGCLDSLPKTERTTPRRYTTVESIADSRESGALLGVHNLRNRALVLDGCQRRQS